MAKKPTISDILKELSERVFKLEDDVRKLKIKQSKFDNKTIGGFAQYVSPKEMGYESDENLL